MSNYLPFVSKKPLKKLLLHLTLWVFGLLAVLTLLGYLAVQFSPWPNALLVRALWEQRTLPINQALEKHLPTGAGQALRNLRYSAQNKELALDIFYPALAKSDQQTFPVLVWVPGGAWVAGSKNEVTNYAKILAAQGFAVVVVDYELAPISTYPEPLRQVNTALTYLLRNAQRLRLDTSTWLLAGHSSGAHLAAQLATAINEPTYAQSLSLRPALAREQLAGVLLYNGIYDMQRLPLGNAFIKQALATGLWAYSGSKNFATEASFTSASVQRFITHNFPPTFISATALEPLKGQSQAFAQALSARSVPVQSLFVSTAPEYDATANNNAVKIQTAVTYPFDLDSAAGQSAWQAAQQFLATHGLSSVGAHDSAPSSRF